MDLKNSQTKENLMRAFAGESQARNRYTLAAGQAKKLDHHVIEKVFDYTAQQEKEHAEVFYKFLKEANGENIEIDGSYPVDNYEDVYQLLRSAEHNEKEEHDVVYRAFGDKALEEGFTRIGRVFHEIGKVEETHAKRFARFAELWEQNKLYCSDQEEKWICLNCGFVYEGKEAPKQCPVCEHSQGYFVRACLAPFGNGVY
ncbi:MAG: rubrerythrin family protein [Lachnospiraceae bacterium]|nr:rubrerythrin family protein [Lachnospiraceae bacterium]